LCHDFGKSQTTVRNDQGRWISPEHAERGTTLAEAFLGGMRAPGSVVETIVPLVAEHMAMLAISANEMPSPRVVRKLARRLAPATIELWAAVCEADASGRPPKPRRNPVSQWMAVANQLALLDAEPRPLLLGRHLIPLGYLPGREMGTILKTAFEAQIDGEFQTLDEGIQWVQQHYPGQRSG
jgi:tRNA nucleotidyltransferase (CCA-adding enzyme)